MASPRPLRLSKTTLYLLIAALAALGGITAWLGPSYFHSLKVSASKDVTIDQQHVQIVELKAELDATRKERSENWTRGSIKEPVMLAGGVPAYRTVKWETKSTSEIESRVRAALAQAQMGASSMTTEDHESITTKEKTVKRSTVDVGLGWGSEGRFSGLLGARVLGPLGCWGSVAVDPGGRVDSSSVGAKLSF